MLDEREKELVELTKTVHVLREALKDFINPVYYDFGGVARINGIKLHELFEAAKQALTTPDLSNLIVLTREELEKWPCGCSLVIPPYRCWRDSYGKAHKGKCPRCLRLEEMEKAIRPLK